MDALNVCALLWVSTAKMEIAHVHILLTTPNTTHQRNAVARLREKVAEEEAQAQRRCAHERGNANRTRSIQRGPSIMEIVCRLCCCCC